MHEIARPSHPAIIPVRLYRVTECKSIRLPRAAAAPPQPPQPAGGAGRPTASRLRRWRAEIDGHGRTADSRRSAGPAVTRRRAAARTLAQQDGLRAELPPRRPAGAHPRLVLRRQRRLLAAGRRHHPLRVSAAAPQRPGFGRALQARLHPLQRQLRAGRQRGRQLQRPRLLAQELQQGRHRRRLQHRQPGRQHSVEQDDRWHPCVQPERLREAHSRRRGRHGACWPRRRPPQLVIVCCRRQGPSSSCTAPAGCCLHEQLAGAGAPAGAAAERRQGGGGPGSVPRRDPAARQRQRRRHAARHHHRPPQQPGGAGRCSRGALLLPQLPIAQASQRWPQQPARLGAPHGGVAPARRRPPGHVRQRHSRLQLRRRGAGAAASAAAGNDCM
jgi:hypothetical protein